MIRDKKYKTTTKMYPLLMFYTLKMLEKITICNDCKYCSRKTLNSAILREESFDVYFLNNAGKHLIYGKHFYQL